MGAVRRLAEAGGGVSAAERATREPWDSAARAVPIVGSGLAAARARVVMERVAVHEAGHVAAAALLKVPLWGRVSVIADVFCDGSAEAGHSISNDELDAAMLRSLAGLPIRSTTRQKVETDVMVLMAGPIAELAGGDWGLYPPLVAEPASERWTEARRDRYLTAIEVRPDVIAMSDEDQQATRLRSVSATEPEARAHWDWLGRRTWVLAASPAFRRIVEAVAAELMDRRELSQRQCQAAIRRAFLVPPNRHQEIP
jgi:hypothetical protein